jgi:hypothetical protein
MLHLVVHQLRQRGALPAVQFRPFPAAYISETGEVLAARAHLKKLKSESLMFDATGNSQTRMVHGAPVENLRAPHYVKGETKANIIFRLTFALPLPEPPPGQSLDYDYQQVQSQQLHKCFEQPSS